MMTSGARYTVAREGPVLRAGVQQSLACKHPVIIGMVDMKLALTHHTVTAQAQVLNEECSIGLTGQVLVQGRLGIQLGEKDRVAARQSHHRVAPLAERREILERATPRVEDHPR